MALIIFYKIIFFRGTQVEVKNKKGNSPLWLAANGGHLNVVDLLYHAGADIDSQDNRKVYTSAPSVCFFFASSKIFLWIIIKLSSHNV